MTRLLFVRRDMLTNEVLAILEGCGQAEDKALIASIEIETT